MLNAGFHLDPSCTFLLPNTNLSWRQAIDLCPTTTKESWDGSITDWLSEVLGRKEQSCMTLSLAKAHAIRTRRIRSQQRFSTKQIFSLTFSATLTRSG